MAVDRFAIRTLRAAAALLLAAGLAACGGSDDDDNPPAASATIGAAGGTMAGPSGSQLVVPVGALAQPTSITIAQSDSGAPALPAGSATVGAMFALTPHGTSFAAPATIVVSFDAGLLPAGSAPRLLGGPTVFNFYWLEQQQQRAAAPRSTYRSKGNGESTYVGQGCVAVHGRLRASDESSMTSHYSGC